MRAGSVLMVAFALIVLFAALASATMMRDVRENIIKYYLEAYRIYREGGNVSAAIRELNNIIRALEKGASAEELDARFANVEQLLSIAEEEAMLRRRRLMYEVAAGAGIGALTVALLARYAPRAYYRIKLWYLSQYIVRRGRRAVRGKKEVLLSTIMSEEVQAVLLAIMVVCAVFAVAYPISRRRVVEPFCALGTLGPKQKIGGYPREVLANQTIKLWGYVYNYMGYPAYFRVLVKLGNASTPMGPNGFEAPVLLARERILLHNETWLFPITIRISKPGVNYRIILELWMYNLTTGGFTYTGRWNQIWVNVTAPALGT